MSLNGWTLNGSYCLDGLDAYNDTGAGNDCTFVQSVCIGGSGNICTFKQDVQLRETGAGQLVAIKQKVVKNTVAQQICVFKQVVENPPAINTFLGRNRWYPVIYINGNRISDELICDNIKIIRQESYASLASFTLLSIGEQTPGAFIGAHVQIFAMTRNGGYVFKPLFTGYIATPDVNIITRKTTYNCTDLRETLINNTLGDVIPYIGYWNRFVFTNEKDLAASLSNRLTTTPQTLDFNASGSVTISDLLAKPFGDFILGDADVYRSDKDGGPKDPIVKLVTLGRLLNYIDCTATYQYQRCYERKINWQWNTDWTPCEFLQNGYSVCKRTMISTAVSGAGWPLVGDIAFTPMFGSGFYTCGGITLGWSTTEESYATQNKTDASGNIIKNADGSNQQQQVITSNVDLSATICMGAAWRAATRFCQNLTEKYTMIVQAPGSINQYQKLQQSTSVGITSDFDSQKWEAMKTYSDPPSQGIYTNVDGTTWNLQYTGGGIDMSFNADTRLSDFNDAQAIGLNQAATSIVKSHRDNHVIFNKFLWPELDLIHTVELNCSKLQCVGKVYRIEHEMNINTGEANTKVDLALSLSNDSFDSSDLLPPVRVPYVINTSLTTVTGMSPLNGPLAPGATVDLIGTNFTGATMVAFNYVAATSFTVLSDTHISAIYPAGLGNAVALQPLVVVSGTGVYDPIGSNSGIFDPGPLERQPSGMGIISLQTHVGEEPTAKFNGYIGNKMIQKRVAGGIGVDNIGRTVNAVRTTFTEQFIVDSPTIENVARSNQESAGTSIYNIAIQNDLLTIIYD